MLIMFSLIAFKISDAQNTIASRFLFFLEASLQLLLAVEGKTVLKAWFAAVAAGGWQSKRPRNQEAAIDRK